MNNPEQTYNNPQEHLSQDQLIRYQEDRMDDAEMHRTERHLLECELCSDALEGISLLQPQQSEFHLQDLQNRLSGSLQSRKAASSPSYWKWAAAAAMLLVAVSVLFLLNNYWGDRFQGGQEIVQQETRNEQGSDAAPLSATEKDSIGATEPAMSQAAEQSASSRSPIAEGNEEARPSQSSPPPAVELKKADKAISGPTADEPAETGREEYLTEEIIFEETPIAEIESDMDTLAGKESEQPSLPEISGTNKENYIADRNVTSMRSVLKPGLQPSAYKELKGKITDTYGDPIPGVSIRIKGTDKGTLTDMDGSYSLQLPATDTSLMISFIGYTSKEVNVQDTAIRLETMLEEDVATLSEVVVTGYGSQRESAEKVAITPPQPVGGMRAYKKYLKSNRRYTAEAREAGIEGVVVVEFYIAPDGSLENFEIKKSLGHGLDAEAIRLIQEGPTWQPASSANQAVRHKARVRVPFRLE